MINIYAEEFDLAAGENKRETEHLKGELLLRKGLKKDYGIDYGENNPVPVIKGEYGKPQLKDYPHIFHNISHTAGMAACAIGDVPVGIDVEEIRPFSEKIIRKVMSEQEKEQFYRLKEEERTAFFFKIWTLKESYVKAGGWGITIPLTEFSFELRPDGITCSVPGVQLVQYCLKERYILSLCTIEKTELCFNKIL
ncbi:4'-phosphopantetheinyl transferase family protein [Lacrimispora defluvii]|uniref:4'-phosphopantetheinyl transferase superfamily protein n=1 Tax=Lacrimispora defluvii TaxID=2719233 RepID=A0ABX1VWR1_9FIRM|nr:4'-phosphopantetheinyl transferase superfamily protein [Lacrimispora defluvii]NNJ32272.1 4'-phosphopantetheinyl transferase superfamily protein [Lacrimispora defluvii]